MTNSLSELKKALQGEFYYQETGLDNAMRLVYASDASIYQEKPLAVALPKNEADLKTLIQFAATAHVTLIPRAAGTSLAGQVVGNGIVVDISKYFDQILEINPAEKWVRVQPGVIRDDLNKKLKPFGLMFGPETSTASRAMIGGMVGNNSCGLHSIRWGSTRDHLLEAKVLLSNGEAATIGALTESELNQLVADNGYLGSIYKNLFQLLQKPENQSFIQEKFPHKNITRRNSGYALDALLETTPFSSIHEPFNLCKLIAGSEGTLCFLTELKLQLMELPSAENALLCIHCTSVGEALKANLIAMRHDVYASELVDKRILDFTKDNLHQRPNRFFIQGDPGAILMVEFFTDDREHCLVMAEALIQELKQAGLGYAFPVLFGSDAVMAWDVRKGGLGLLRNMPGDEQPVNLIEDCAVAIEDLPQYVADLDQLLHRHGLVASYYAHAGAGELHVEPMLNLKTAEGKMLFRTVLAETVELVKKYNGSLSGEHGDGRLRGEFIPAIMGPEVYELFREVKRIFDPHFIFNAGKIVDTPPMDEYLRYVPDQTTPQINTVFSFAGQGSILRLAEKCSGSGDCRKTQLTGGVMCPSYMATRQEKDTTRARANILRQFLTQEGNVNGFNHEEIKDVMDLCISCKGCKSECPSGVDIAKMKAEFLQHYYDANGTPLRTRLIGNFTRLNALASKMPWAYNTVMNNGLTGKLAKQMVGFAPQRTLPPLAKTTLRSWYKQWKKTAPVSGKKVYFFADEFTNYNDVEIGIKGIQLLTTLGYNVIIPEHVESGRTYLSKGLVRDAQKIAIRNVELLSRIVTKEAPIVGLEPSAILTLVDEYLDLVPDFLLAQANALARHSFYLDDFLAAEVANGFIRPEQFTTASRHIKLHGHCHQKALSTQATTVSLLSLPTNYQVSVIPSGCCGMAGSFGYEAEHYDVSMQIGELVLFPAVRAAEPEVLIAAPGTSCRHQIKDGTSRQALHPVEILWEALRK
ncbi:FAD-binding and (Fe-S)-binding domain-containing protein [Adhaeribacter radiodurans]|uniref:FAD-binding protein n=1 Tax=Adhaeribacter radiodurans TaxID=2745197 RepID=A0A7L7LB75_9BACT|nr:FAD-binding and (Fe-S)-binding domain-containing protein [Adhaeribacter radiodurans]QMU29805.1 FAD-binding protein [Adhaeribacter radiodurans]